MRRVVSVTIVLALIVAAGCRWFRIKVEDEGPIIVKNGSMTVDTADDTGTWGEDTDWSNETTGKQHHGDLWVLVIYKDRSFCPATSDNPPKPAPANGSPLQIEYTQANFKAKFNVVGNPARTKVGPKNDLERDQAHKRLQHGMAGDNQYITGVKLPPAGPGGQDRNLDCDFSPAKLDQIKICSSEAKCQDAIPVAVAPHAK